MLGLVPFSVMGGLWGPGRRGPRPGDVGGIHWVIVRVPRHGPIKPAQIRRESVARDGQVDAFPAGLPDRQALVECVVRLCVFGSYKGVLFGKVGSPRVVQWARDLSSYQQRPATERACRSTVKYDVLQAK